MSRKLIVTDGRRERELLLVTKIVVGRDPTCDLSEADPLLSRRHAEFAIAGDDIVVRDLGSRNGIYVNGARIAEGTLQSGDVVRIGRLQMRYIEDSAPLVAVPELVDDATGLVFPGARGAAASAASIAQSAKASTPTPVPAPADDADADATSYAPASGIRKPPRTNVPSGSSAHVSQSRAAQPSRSGSQPAPADDSAQQTRVVPPPGRTALQPPPAPPIRTAVQPPPAPPVQEEELTSFATPRPRTAVQAPPAPPGIHTAVQPPPAPPAMQTAVQPPPSPPLEDRDEPTSVVLARPRTAVQPRPVDPAPGDIARQARALAIAVEAIATFLGSASISRNAADAVRTLERDLASTAPPADLVDALKGLVARLGAAANELT